MCADRHMSYFNLLDALKSQKSCAFCFLEAKAVRSSLESVMYESVNDPGVRATLARSKGYCHAHARVLLNIGDALGTALVYKSVLQDFLHTLDALDERGGRVDSRRRDWLNHAGCPACRIQQEARCRYVRVLLSGLNEDDMRAAFEGSAGLCVPHLLGFLDMVTDRATRRYLMEVHRAKYGDLLQKLEAFCRKHDYRHSKEGFGPESDSWMITVKMIVGGDV